MPREPLADAEQFRTGDLDLIREIGGRVLVPHRVDAFGPVSASARMNAATLGSTTLAYMRYESDIRLEAPTTDATYFVTIPLTGKAEAERGTGEVAVSTPSTGVAYRADDRGVITFSPDYTMLFLRIERHILERTLEGLLSREITVPLCFDFTVNLQSPTMRTWTECVALLRSAMERGAGANQETLLSARIEDLVLTGLLLGQPHNYSERLQASREPARPRTMKRAIDLLEQQPDRPWPLAELARATGVSARTLQEGFQRHLGITPTGYLREVRLQRVHQELLDPGEHMSVTKAAHRWGFGNLGRFAVAYRRKFGESPSETLRRSGPA